MVSDVMYIWLFLHFCDAEVSGFQFLASFLPWVFLLFTYSDRRQRSSSLASDYVDRDNVIARQQEQ